MRLKLARRGQGIAIDFLCAALVFLLLFNAAMNLIEGSNKSVLDKTLLNELNARAEQTLDMLVRTDGQPNNWQEKTIDEVTMLGLAKRDRVLDNEKVEKFTQWASVYRSEDYNKAKALLLIGYDYYFKISDSGGTVLEQTGQPDSEMQKRMMAVTTKRIVNLDGGEAIAGLTIYYQKA